MNREQSTDSGHQGVFDTMTSGGGLLLILIFVGTMAFLAVAPYKVLRGEAEGVAQYVAGFIAMGFWALAIGSVATML
jgi:hypothetical protein